LLNSRSRRELKFDVQGPNLKTLWANKKKKCPGEFRTARIWRHLGEVPRSHVLGIALSPTCTLVCEVFPPIPCHPRERGEKRNGELRARVAKSQ